MAGYLHVVPLFTEVRDGNHRRPKFEIEALPRHGDGGRHRVAHLRDGRLGNTDEPAVPSEDIGHLLRPNDVPGGRDDGYADGVHGLVVARFDVRRGVGDIGSDNPPIVRKRDVTLGPREV